MTTAPGDRRIGAVCVTYNSAEQLEGSLGLLGGAVHTVVVDNNSTDASASIARGAGAQVTVLPRNVGFGNAANLGIGLLPDACEIVALVNPDLFLAAEQVHLLAQVLDQRPEVGIVAPRLVFPDGSSQLSARPFPSFVRLLGRAASGFKVRSANGAVRPDWVIGAAMVVRRRDFVRLGGFDTRFFLYYEDMDLCWRYRADGYSVLVEDDVSVVHGYERASRRKWAFHQPAVRLHWRAVARLAKTYPREFFAP